MDFDNLPPTERMIIPALHLNAEMTLEDLMRVTLTKTKKYMLRTLRTLILCHRIERIDNSTTYRLVR